MAVKPDLGGVPETALWTLWFRSVEARRPDRVLEDPFAISLVERLDYPFAEKFGDLFPSQGQIQGLRVRTFDKCVSAFLHDHPHGTVVALGEGLETQFWRIDNGTLTWVTVDLPESVALRTTLLPREPRQKVFAGSALDPQWMELVDPARGVMITAQGLLMYLQPSQVSTLISMCAKAFPGGFLVFDAVPAWTARLILRATRRFRPPPLPWTLPPSRLASLQQIDPRIAEVREVRPLGGRGLIGWLAPRLRHMPLLGARRPMIVMLRFADSDSS